MLLHLEKILFYLLIFCLPFQTRKILYQWGGDFNEWSSAYLYLTDLLIILIILFWAWRLKKQRFLKDLSANWLKKKIKTPDFWLIVFLIISLISLAQARNIQLGFYQWLKLLELVGLFFYLKYNLVILSVSEGSRRKQLLPRDSSPSAQNDRLGLRFERLAQILIVSGLFQSLIAFAQYGSQKSLGLKFLRESPLGPEMTGVAKMLISNLSLVRPYGTFPHPNLLAAFLLICLFFFFFIYFKQKPWSKKFILGGLTKKDFLPPNGLLLAGVYPLLSFALFFTFSRIIIFTFLLASLLFFIWTFLIRPQLRSKVIELFLLLVIFCFLFGLFLWPEVSSRFLVSLEEQTVSLRVFYNQTALSLIKEHPFLGIGLGNFVWQIKQMLHLLASWLHQPVHNIYLLIANEVGLIGLVMFLMFIFGLLLSLRGRRPKQSRPLRRSFSPRLRRVEAGSEASGIRSRLPRSPDVTSGSLAMTSLLLTVFCFLFIGLFDHFFWTLQQGQLMFWLALGMIASFSKRKTP